MYKINENINFKEFIDMELIQLSIGLYQIILNFSGDVCISIQSLLKLDNLETEILVSCDKPESSKHLVCLLGSKIVDVNILSETILVLTFDNEMKLSLIDNSEQYESFDIQTPTQNIII